MTRNAHVVVAGGGPAGIVAAIAAARHGAKITLIEQQGFVGGMAGTGLSLLAFHDNAFRRVVGGVPWEMVRRMMAKGNCVVYRNDGKHDGDFALEFFHSTGIRYSPELFKQVATEMLLEAGVDILCRTLVTGTLTSNGRIDAVVIENKSGRSELSADVIVDCTGDGDLAARAGAAFELGSRGDGVFQPMTMLFAVGNIDVERAMASGAMKRTPWNVMEPVELTGKFRSYILDMTPWADVLKAITPSEVPPITRFRFHDQNDGMFQTGNFIHISHLDGTNGEQLARGETVGRLLVWRLVEILRQHVPGFEEVRLVQIATHLGVRETRRIRGEYYLTDEDALTARQFEDSVAQCGYFMDIHDPDSSDFTQAAGGGQIADEASFGIPYGALVPQSLDGLILAGRCVSGSRAAQSAFRVMGTCMAMGQAAGTAAAMSSLGNVPLREIDVAELRRRLTDTGAIVDRPLSG
ncbi:MULTISPECIES: FAD-dependent oxidoreductase [unclassified Chelatococcus]|uniref:FAD-dependent oxidoreductase n=1 Tax=unclassified Chelatococcus TaxID=2638111 RepID=UPI001BD17286|nr:MULTISPECIES: FAD-dependent oxidoreductase [unclassified Chelatococcus]CAH1659641.1 putative FAD-dependent oxidoreductase [Hyphomicrobiales bacterium]MBS7740971.1 FAD-dependent oxidoreductase [Chelatococcus sp. HY11]MBX3545157.1 FAD-dependent oxidoreductase [Chelatococcus sp.]MCO5077790.1 FAD-dependent oxidoreductase [Chelatococcus sp.]CAH1683748.1 putative FAD-dependent oxidoreductase [Hyphomicrobiales bacterium]